MPHYVRILSPTKRVPSVAKMKKSLASAELAGKLTLESGTNTNWIQLSLEHDGGEAIANIERDSTAKGTLVADEIAEFLEDIEDCKPASAVSWLADYLPTVKTIYALQILSGIYDDDGWDIFGDVRQSILAQAGGIIQADAEGFSNEDGYHILWQFDNTVKGMWWIAVLKEGEWVPFRMNLGNKKHRQAFFEGKVPKGVEMG